MILLSWNKNPILPCNFRLTLMVCTQKLFHDQNIWSKKPCNTPVNLIGIINPKLYQILPTQLNQITSMKNPNEPLWCLKILMYLQIRTIQNESHCCLLMMYIVNNWEINAKIYWQEFRQTFCWCFMALILQHNRHFLLSWPIKWFIKIWGKLFDWFHLSAETLIGVSMGLIWVHWSTSNWFIRVSTGYHLG